VVRDVGRFTADEVAPMVRYLDNPLPTTALVLAAGAGAISPRLLSGVRTVGQVVSTKVASRDTREWVRTRLRQSPVEVDAEAERLIELHLGEEVSRLGALLEVLSAAYGEGAYVGADDVRPYLAEAGSVAPWDFTDAIGDGRTHDSLLSLHRLLGGGERHPLVVLALLHRHMQSLLRVDNPAIRTESQAAEAMGIAKGRSTYPAKKALATSRRWGSARIGEALGLLAQAEVDLKGASGCPEHLVLEVLVARLCRLARAAAGAGSGADGRRLGGG
jgi:DNA polymerase-3 subunit delta